MLPRGRCAILSSVLCTLVVLAAAPLQSQTTSGERASHPAAGRVAAPSASEIRAIMVKIRRGEAPTPQEAAKVDAFFHAAGTASTPSPQIVEALSPFFDDAPSDIKKIVDAIRRGHTATAAESDKVKAYIAQTFGGGIPHQRTSGAPGVAATSSRSTARGAPSSSSTSAGKKYAGAAAPGASDAVHVAAAALNSAVCPAKPPTGAATLLDAAPPDGNELSATLQKIIQQTLQAEDPGARSKLEAAVGSATSPAALVQFGAMLWMFGASNGGAYALANAAQRSSDAQALTNLGAALNSMGDYRNALVVLRAALAKDSTLVPARNNLAVATANLGDLRGAERTLQQVLRSAPALSEARFSLGRVLQCEGDMVHALAAMRQSLEERPSHARQQFMMAVWRTTNVPMVDAVFNTDPDATNSSAGSTTSGAPQPTNATHIDGALSSLSLPGALGDYVAMTMHGAFTKAAQQDGARSARYFSEQAELEAHLPKDQAGFVLHRGDTVVIQISDRAIVKMLDSLQRSAGAQLENISGRFGTRQEQIEAAVNRASAQADEVASRGGNPCSVWGPALAAQYGQFLADYNANFTALNAVAKAYASRASTLIAQLHDPMVADDETLNALIFIADIQTDANTNAAAFMPYMALQCYGSGRPPSEHEATTREPSRHGPCEELLEGKAIVLSFKIDCRSVTLSAGEGLLGELKFDIHTHAGTLFLGGGLKAEGPGVHVGSVEIGSKSASLSGKIGVTLAFDGNGNFTDAGFTTATEAGLGGKSVDITQTVWAMNGMQYSPDAANLMK